MGNAQNRLKMRKDAVKRLAQAIENRDHTMIIHYSCERFYDRTDGSSPRITSIAVRHLGSGQTKSFSIHQMAEIDGLTALELEQRYDELEKKMLAQFYEYAVTHSNDIWLHWNMRDINYGFEALGHRMRVLGDEPKEIREDKRVDLAHLLKAIYGDHYAEHPRLQSIMKMNSISDMDFLSGEDEASAFEAKEYVRLHQSTLRKVSVIASVAQHAYDGTLKTKSSIRDKYRDYPQALVELIQENWVIQLILFLIAVIGFIMLFLE